MFLKYPLCLLVFLFFSANVWSQTTFKPTWDNGFKVSNGDGSVKLKFGGRINYDAFAMHQDQDLEDQFGTYSNGVEFRRVRFYHSGVLYSNLGYKLQLDFSEGKVALKDVYFELKKIPVVGNIRVGHFKEAFRLEILTSGKYITFMERSVLAALSPERNTGIMLYDQLEHGRLNWQLALFRDADSGAEDEDAGDGFVINGRLAGVIPLAENEDQYIHLGAAYLLRNPNDEVYSIASRPETHVGPKYLNTSSLQNVKSVQQFGLEAVFAHMSFAFQSEYALSLVKQESRNLTRQFNISSVYAQVSYFITGECRPYLYKKAHEGYGRIKPAKNFGADGGGAWELALRFTHNDWNDDDVSGGELNDITVGINWYLNPAARIMFNFINADLKGVGNSNIYQMRFHVDF